MKKLGLLLTTIITFGLLGHNAEAGVLVSASDASFEVVNATIDGAAQVSGIILDSGERALVYTGRTAARIAHDLGHTAFDASKHIIVATGDLVDSIVANSYHLAVDGIEATGRAVQWGGEMLWINTQELTRAAVNLAKDAPELLFNGANFVLESTANIVVGILDASTSLVDFLKDGVYGTANALSSLLDFIFRPFRR